MVPLLSQLRQAELGAPAQLFGAECCDVDKQETTFDGRRRVARALRFLGGNLLPILDFELGHKLSVYRARPSLCKRRAPVSFQLPVHNEDGAETEDLF